MLAPVLAASISQYQTILQVHQSVHEMMGLKDAPDASSRMQNDAPHYFLELIQRCTSPAS